MRIRTALLALVLGLFAGASPAHGQEAQTLFDGDVSHGGFGAPVVKFSGAAGDLGVWVGGRGGWIINANDAHALSLGGGGYGLATSHAIPNPEAIGNPEIDDPRAVAGYGGFELEYTNRSYRLLHWTASMLIGGGSVTARSRDFEEIDDEFDQFFAIEPGLYGELNVTSFFRIHVGVSYLLTSGIDRGGFGDGDFSGLNGSLTLKFGSFL